jgi:molybdenum cofactor cytidylyltransferase
VNTSNHHLYHAALIPAAGYSVRFGADKRKQLIHNGTLLTQTVNKAIDAYEEVLIVIRYDDDEIRKELEQYDARVIAAPSCPVGLGKSIATGISALSHCHTISICLADMPFISLGIHEELLKKSSPQSIVRPFYRNKPGHPVIFGSDFFMELECLSGDQGALPVIKKNLASLISVEVNDRAVITDIDIKRDLEKFLNQ